MSKKKKGILLTLFYVLLLFIIIINSITIVEWLNRSLFTDFDLGTERENNYLFGEFLIILLISVLLYSIIGTFLVSLIATNLLFGTLVIANNIKVKERNEFITFSELQTISSPTELLSFIDVSMGKAVSIIAFALFFITILQYTIFKVSKRMNFKFYKKVRLVFFIVPLLILTFIFLQPNLFNKHVLKFEESKLHNWNPVNRAKRDGFIPSFIHTVKPTYMDKPNGYTKSNIKNISRKYTKLAKDINRNRNQYLRDAQTILYLSESLIDPQRIPNLLLNESPIPFINDISEKNIGGTIYSQYIGGGTANIEWSVLTSFSLEVFNEPLIVTPYSDFYAQSKNHNSVLSYYNTEKVAIHPYTAHLYKRNSIYKAMHFDDFLYLDNGIEFTDKLGSHVRVSDEALNNDILKSSSNDDIGLLHVLTMQNHSPFTGEIPEMSYIPKINTDMFSADRESDLFNYLQGLKASDQAIEELVTELDKSEKDINILLYGDHFPSIFTGLEDLIPKEKIQETPWFLYMNNDRSSKEKNFDGLSPAFLVTVLLREGGYYVSPFQGLMDELLSQGIKRIGNNFVVTDEGILKDKELPDQLREMIEDYRVIMYDALFGHDWLGDDLYTPKL